MKKKRMDRTRTKMMEIKMTHILSSCKDLIVRRDYQGHKNKIWTLEHLIVKKINLIKTVIVMNQMKTLKAQ